MLSMEKLVVPDVTFQMLGNKMGNRQIEGQQLRTNYIKSETIASFNGHRGVFPKYAHRRFWQNLQVQI